MIIVIDTNVIVSSLLSPHGPPAQPLRHWEAGEFQVATSLPLLSELERVLNYERVRRYYREPLDKIAALLERLRAVASVVEPELTVDVVEQDPADDRVLECAIAGGASYIVTGDVHLVALKEYRGITILSPAAFIAMLGSG